MPMNAAPAPPPRPPRRSLGRGPGAHPLDAGAADPRRPAEGPAEAEQPRTGPVPAPSEAPSTVPAEAEQPRTGPVPTPTEGPDEAAAPGGPEAGAAADPATEIRPETQGAAEAPTGRRSAGDGEDATEAGGRFTVRLDNFEGPFDLLLQLISKHRLDVTEVALSKVTDEFMAHIRAMGPDWDLDQTTEFLVVAATLLDLKAARLLPAAEVEDEADLALLEARDLLFARLLQYRAYKQIADIFSGRLDDEARRHPRTVGLEPHHAELLPEVVISIGAEGFARLAVKAMQPRPKPQVYVDHIHAPLVSVREQAEVVVARLRAAGEASFQELVEDAPDTLTVVARFLALLELYREKAVTLDQEEALGALTVRWAGGEGAEPRVTDEFDREPTRDEPDEPHEANETHGRDPDHREHREPDGAPVRAPEPQEETA
ncbi:segregation/condensation protein A [Streptomyces sp. LX-29]|uniref:segregation and condensation protein A n=1 Tax=Streptomyces sp. LX-29 TaxID=2900152 RepID=UPI00240D9F34|nr:segregation/condensation protein A [Streptomyces sp. LX-29]WFB10261.1 segregation/condensation protein A [Streptomyces sp. LX-29]